MAQDHTARNTLYPTKPKSLESESQESAEIHAKYVLSTDYVAGSVGGVRNPTIPWFQPLLSLDMT